MVNLVASPTSGYRFVNWTGNVGTIANVNAATTTITVNGDCQITANFEEEEAVTFADRNLEAVVRETISKPAGLICPSELQGLTSLDADHKNIADLTGLEHCSDLTYLDLWDNQISDISAVANLTNLTELWLGDNQISDISYLVDNEGLSTGDEVYLSENPLSSDSINIYIPQLEARGVVVEYLRLLSPAPGSIAVPVTDITFTWTEVTGADLYDWVLSLNADLSSPIINVTGVVQTRYTMTSETALAYDNLYYWQVTAYSEGAAIMSSPIGTFTTISAPP